MKYDTVRFTYLISKKGYVNRGLHNISENLPAYVQVSKNDYVWYNYCKGKEILK